MSVGRIVVEGVAYDVTLSPVLTPPPAPPPAPQPVTATAVRIGTAAYPVAGVNVPRLADQLVVLTGQPPALTSTNQFGTEVTVQGSKVTRTNDRQPLNNTQGTPLVADGYLLSGHGKARDWLITNAKIGTDVVLTVGPVPTPTPAPTPAPAGRTIAVYVMDGVGNVSQVPRECNQIRVAFLQGSTLVEWGGDTPAQTAAALTAWRAGASDRRVLLSVGGQGGAVNLGALTVAFDRIDDTFPVDGIDWDIEAGALDVPTAVAVSKALAKGREASWVTAFTPPGGPPVTPYLEAAKQCQAAGLRVQFGQQLYDTRIALADVLAATGRAVTALGAPSVVIGCMVGTDPAKYSTVTLWETYAAAVRKQWPDIGGAYLWESARDGTAAWATAMGRALA